MSRDVGPNDRSKTWLQHLPQMLADYKHYSRMVERGPWAMPGRPLTDADHHLYERQAAALDAVTAEFQRMARAADHDARVATLTEMGNIPLKAPKERPKT